MEHMTCGNSLSFQKWFIGNDIREILLNDEDIAEQIGTNVFPLIAPENTVGDFILYQRDGYSKQRDMHTNVVSDKCTVNLIAIADNYDNALRLASLIDNAVSGIHTNNNGERFICELADSSETFQDDKYLETLSYKIK